MNLRDLFSRNSSILKRSIDIENTELQESTGFALSYLGNYSNHSSMTLSAVFAAVEMISNSVALLPIHIRDTKGNIIENHYLNEVFSKNLLSKFTLMKQLVADMLINGNGIAYIEMKGGIPSGLVYCNKGEYTINYDPIKLKLEYTIPKISSRSIPKERVIHILKNSVDGVIGKGLIYYASRSLGTANAAEDQASGYFESGCGINGILKSAKHLSKKQLNEIQVAWNNAHNGTNKSNLAVLPVDLDFVQLAGNASDAQLLETRLFSVQEIARFFNISPTLLQDLSHSSYSTLEASLLEFLVHTLSPIIMLIQDELNRKLVINDNVVIDLDEDHILRADKSATASYLNTLVNSGIISINEARHTLGLEPIEGGDKNIIPYTNLELNTILGSGDKLIEDTKNNQETDE